MSDIAKELMEKQSQLASKRSTFEEHWAQIAPLVLPRQDNFFEKRQEQGERRTRDRFDDTAVLAHDKAVKIMDSIITPEGSTWHKLRPKDDRLEEDQEVMTFLDSLNKYLFKTRYSPKSNFANQNREKYASLFAFGTGVLMLEDIVGYGMRYKSSHLSEHYVMENLHGLIDIDYRKYRLTARQAMEKFKERAPQKVREMYDKNPAEYMDFLHVVTPDEGGDAKGMKFASYHVSCADKQLISVGGFKTFPYIFSRGATAPNETYGRSPAMMALAEIKMLNAMRRTDIKARHLMVDPPILAADAQTVRKFSLKPDAINYGTLDMNGNPLVRPWQAGANISLSNDGIQQSRDFINDAFFVNLFQILIDTPQMTATEVLERAKEKGALLGPIAGREQSEALAPMVEREIGILEDYGIFEDDGMLPMPRKLKEAGGIFEVTFSAPANQLARAEEALSTERTIQALIPIAQISPEVAQAVLAPVDWVQYGKIMRDANGAPAKLFKTDEAMLATAQAQAQQMQAQQMMQVAPQVAGAIKDIAQAQSY